MFPSAAPIGKPGRIAQRCGTEAGLRAQIAYGSITHENEVLITMHLPGRPGHRCCSHLWSGFWRAFVSPSLRGTATSIALETTCTYGVRSVFHPEQNAFSCQQLMIASSGTARSRLPVRSSQIAAKLRQRCPAWSVLQATEYRIYHSSLRHLLILFRSCRQTASLSTLQPLMRLLPTQMHVLRVSQATK